MNCKVLAIHGAHDASVTFVDKNNQIRIFEFERFCGKRYASFNEDGNGHLISEFSNKDNSRSEFLDLIKINLKCEPEVILYSDLYESDINFMSSYFPKATFFRMGHHISHCAGAYFQSGFADALAISLDGGGMDYVSESDLSLITFSVYKFIDGVGHVIDYYGMSDNGDDQFNPGAYGFVGRYISEIVGNDPLQSAGKIMGLSAYGKVREEWIDPLKSFYKNAPQDYWGKFYYLTHQLSQKMKLTLDYKVLSGQDSYDLAATNQHVFEELCFSFIKKYIDKYEMNVVFSGGCALNVLFNQKLFKYVRDKGLNLYVPPYPGDNGLSFGHYTSFQNLKCDPGPYCGIDILDRNKIIDYYSKYNKEGKVKLTTVETIVDLIKDGKIGGIIQGYSEVGPRALGNRSIICDPSISDMKNILNSKVKFREWFRPFAPVCREEDREIYFEDAFPSEYMSFAPKVKESYRNLLPSITHEDGTARLQTVTKQQHELFYDILTEIRNRDLIGVIMNTSFNIRGKPILTSIDDAFEVLETTELDFIVVENLLFIK